jgi:hypothetical protein
VIFNSIHIQPKYNYTVRRAHTTILQLEELNRSTIELTRIKYYVAESVPMANERKTERSLR